MRDVGRPDPSPEVCAEPFRRCRGKDGPVALHRLASVRFELLRVELPTGFCAAGGTHPTFSSRRETLRFLSNSQALNLRVLRTSLAEDPQDRQGCSPWLIDPPCGWLLAHIERVAGIPIGFTLWVFPCGQPAGASIPDRPNPCGPCVSGMDSSFREGPDKLLRIGPHAPSSDSSAF